MFKSKLVKIQTLNLKERIYRAVESYGFNVDEYIWDLKTFGNIVLKISNDKNSHIFILDRDEYVIDNCPAKFKFNNEHIAGFNTRQVYFILMLEDFLRDNYAVLKK